MLLKKKNGDSVKKTDLPIFFFNLILAERSRVKKYYHTTWYRGNNVLIMVIILLLVCITICKNLVFSNFRLEYQIGSVILKYSSEQLTLVQINDKPTDY